jgi:arsenical pump membrane protein
VKEALALLALAAALAAAVVRDRRAPEAIVALAAAGVLLLAGAISWHDAVAEARALGPTIAVLAALLVLGDGCERAGLFEALAARMAARAQGSATRMLGLVFAAACAVTAVLGLDATVVLLTPAVFAAVARARLPGRPHVYACTHLANSASLLLPISNLTNLLAVRSAGISFTRFAVLMVLPWAVAISVEWVALRRAFAAELAVGREVPPDDPGRLPRVPLYVLAGTLAGFVLAGALGIDAAWPAAAGALAMLVLSARPSPRRLLAAVDLPLLGFVLGLGVIVKAVADHGLGDVVASVLPSGAGVLALIGAAFVAAIAANLLNNVPALLVLLPAAVASGPATVCAVLIGVNAGPNLTYTGSLATLLWRRVVRAHGAEPPHGEFLKLGAVTVPPILIGATVALWLAVQLT